MRSNDGKDFNGLYLMYSNVKGCEGQTISQSATMVELQMTFKQCRKRNRSDFLCLLKKNCFRYCIYCCPLAKAVVNGITQDTSGK